MTPKLFTQPALQTLFSYLYANDRKECLSETLLKVTGSASPGSVRVQITYLKEKLKELGLRIEILTVHGYGYKMVCNEEFFVISDRLVDRRKRKFK